jgi:nitrate reductase cytochrome c-type subunit
VRDPHRESVTAMRRCLDLAIHPVGWAFLSVCFFLSTTCLVTPGCDHLQTSLGLSPTAPSTSLTASTIRADRRAYDGAPPVIPHEQLGASCTACHTTTGMEVPGKGFAPANPHLHTSVVGRTANCRQCHMFAETIDEFAASNFIGLRQDLRRGDRLYAGAPPVIPHPIAMRENCRACHTTPAARPEIRCTHPERTNCVQCHMQRTVAADDIWP